MKWNPPPDISELDKSLATRREPRSRAIAFVLDPNILYVYDEFDVLLCMTTHRTEGKQVPISGRRAVACILKRRDDGVFVGNTQKMGDPCLNFMQNRTFICQL